MERLLKSILRHIDVLYNYLDPISTEMNVEERTRNGSKWDFKFGFPVIIILFTQLYGNFFVVYEEHGHFTMPWMVNDSMIFNHQVFAKATWPQTDIAMSIGCLSAIAIYVSFWRNPFNIDRYYIVCRGSKNIVQIGDNGNLKIS